ncbi:MAG: recombinase family protein [Lachnospiraceae bacterium]|nr:recombinase family protein [Lachnospiraceae bacterium]
MAKKVTVINAVSESKRTPARQKLRVCGYARVSTGSRAQEESYAAQVAYFTTKIENNPSWEFAGVYADEGITGTKAEGRDDFKAMIAACEDGEIDMILTKSIARFARNTVECIQTIRKLKEIGVGVCFEKENI